MNKYQTTLVIAAAVNLVLMLLFPPYDYVGYSNYDVPTFAGFLFLFDDHVNRRINLNFLAIELTTVLINAAIAWMLLRDKVRLRRRMDRQYLVLIGVILNLLLALLFPPFQDHYTASEALVPSFDGFYFIFGDNTSRVLIANMLWVEVMFILINGIVLWLLFCRPSARTLSDAQRFAQPEALLETRKSN